MQRPVLTKWFAIACVVLALPTFGCSDAQELSAPPAAPTVDRDFDQGSRIDDAALSRTQVENLALLGKVWGFAKYHHPAVVTGARNWDYELFRVAPLVLSAPDRARATAAMVTWLDALGAIPACRVCITHPTGVPLPADNAWIEDAITLGPALSDRLKSMHRNRPASQRFVSFVPGVGNPEFFVEDRYAKFTAPDAGYRLLALFRFWNIITYWFPYRDVMNEDWNAVLAEYIPVMMRPLNGDAYRLALIRLIGRIHDTHANIWSDLRVQPPTGTAQAPLNLRFVENRLVVTGYSHATLGPATGLKIGDEIQSIGGVSVAVLVDSLRPYFPASNEPARLRDMANSLTRGTGPVTLAGVGASGAFSFSVDRQPIGTLDRSRAFVNDLPGPTFRMLTDSVAYLKLSSVVATSAATYIEQAQRARVLVIDIRNYPSQFVVFALGGHLVGSPTPFARFTVGDGSNPGAFLFTAPVSQTPRAPRFTGTVVILVDETSQSQAEYTAMAFRVAPGAIVVGSTTAGADGNVSRIPLPGNVEGMISGIGVFYPDGRPTQRIGIVPDLVVQPTVAGIRAGRDEVLEAGVSRALGRAFRVP
ncbi:S41 family peptidase [Gemmatimonas sp.]|uniref:S41 family peptidase n=1 Tax=Gemmatimonas sp. TaxID=1962908 RepID=UPI00333EBC15